MYLVIILGNYFDNYILSMILGVQNQPWLTEMSNPEIFWSKMMVLAVLLILDWLETFRQMIIIEKKVKDFFQFVGWPQNLCFIDVTQYNQMFGLLEFYSGKS